MNIAQTVFETLRQEYDSGMTQEEVAAKHHVRHSQMQPILSGKRSAGGLRIETLDRMFPNATIDLNGNISTSQTGTNNVVVHGENSGTVNNGTQVSPRIMQSQIKAAVDAFRHEVIDAVIGLDIPRMRSPPS